MKVKIKSTPYDGIWYKNLVGQVFEVTENPDMNGLYRLKNNGPIIVYDNEYRKISDGLGIYKLDAEIISGYEEIIAGIKAAKKQLAKEILLLLKEFKKETGLDVQNIEIKHNTYGYSIGHEVRDVEITLENI